MVSRRLIWTGPMRKNFAIFALLIALVAAIFGPGLLRKRGPAGDGPVGPVPAAEGRGGASGARTAAPLKVYVHHVRARNLSEKITANGTLLANESIIVRSEISGKVTSVHFDEGARVKAGDLLVKINDSELAAQLQQTLFRIELAEVQARRQQQLLERGGTSQESFDSATNEVHVLEAEAELIRARLAKTEIRAPFDGVIGLRQVSEGSYLTTESVIASLQDIDRLKLDFSISERHMGRVRTGTLVTFSVAGGAERFEGRVYALEPQIDVATRTLLLRARATNPGGRLIPGAYANVEVSLEEMKDALLVPTMAIVPGLNNRTLYVIENGRAALRTVETGIRLDREIQVVKGIEPGAIVITSGLLQLRPGMPVEAIEESS
jgi:membrane fusion protein (multidrug efflux system)